MAAKITTPTNIADRDLEHGIISALIWDPSINFVIDTDGVTPECFSCPALRRIFKALKSMTNDGISINNPLLVADTVSRMPAEPGENADEDIVSIVMDDSSRLEIATYFPTYIGILMDLAKRRRMYEILTDAQGRMLDKTVPTEETMGFLQKAVVEGSAGTSATIVGFSDLFLQLLQRVDDNINGRGVKGQPTGFKRLDTHGGLHPSDLIIIAADSSQGKTSFATTIALNCAMSKDNAKAVAYYSMEMTPLQLIGRIVAHEAQISANRLIFSRLSDSERRMLDKAADHLRVLNERIFIDERSVTSVESISQSIRFLHARHNVGVAFIDYLQILGLRTARGETREQAIASAARHFKNLAKELDITIVLLSQLNRSTSGGETIPTIARIRDSGEINEAADLTLLLYRPEVYDRLYPKPWDGVNTKDTAMIVIAKDRHGGYGGLGSFIAGFNAQHSYFHDLAELPLRVETNVKQSRPWG